MRYSFSTGDSGFTLDGLSGMGGSITDGAHDITIKNSTFTTHATFDRLANSNILFDHNTHNNIDSPVGAPNARLGFYWTSATPSGVTIQNSVMRGGDSDGVHTGTAVNVLNNEFAEICQNGPNHTDNIQFEGSVGGRIAGNFIHASCPTTQGLTSYDSNTHGVLIEDNVIDISRPWGIELYSDDSSIVRHNTVRWRPDSDCEYSGQECGKISLDRRTTDPVGHGTEVYDNIGVLVTGNGSTAGRADHNVSGQTAVYQGPTTTYNGFKLASNSPVGRNAASDGLDVGVRVGTGTTPTPTPTTPSPTATPTPTPTPSRRPTPTPSPTPTPTPSPSPTPSPTPTPSPSPTPSPTPTPTATPTPTPTPTPSPTATPDTPARAIWTAPTSVTVGTAVVLDGTRSTGDAPISCTWSFENADGSIIWDTATGCKLTKTFMFADTKYVRLIVADADGDTDASSRRSFPANPAPTPTPTPTVTTTPTSTPIPTASPTPPPDTPAQAIWTPPFGVVIGRPVTLDGTRSKGDAPLTCTWGFENRTGSVQLQPPVHGCKVQETFTAAGTTYVELTVVDADGDTNSLKYAFAVRKGRGLDADLVQKKVPMLSVAQAKTKLPTVLRKKFKGNFARASLKRTCTRLVSSVRVRCTVSWRKAGRRYVGTVEIWNDPVSRRLRSHISVRRR